MRNIIFLTIIILSTPLFGQDSTSTSSDIKKILIGVNISPDLSYRTLLNNDGSSTSSSITDSRNNIETAKLGYTLGFNFIYKLNKRFSLGSGLQFSNKGYKSFVSGFTFGNMIDPRQGFVITPTDPSLPNSATFIDNFYYLDIPIKSTLTLGSKKIRFISSLGITTNFLIKTSTTTITEYNDGSSKKTTQKSNDPYNLLNLSPTFSIGAEIKIKNRSFIRVEPTFRYGLLNIIDAPITAKLWNMGVNISYYFSLK